MAAFDSSSRFCVALLLLAVCACATDITCQPGDSECEESIRDIGKAYVQPGPLRKLLWSTQSFNVDTTSESDSFATGRELLAGHCSDSDHSAGAVVECTNSVRTSPGSYEYRCGKGWIGNYPRLGELKWDEKLMEAAQKHAEDNARMGRLSHTGSDGSRVNTRIGRTGYSYGPVSENIAYGHTSAKDVVLGWMCSSGHRDNIMSCNYHEIGVGVARGSNGRLYFAQVFACPSGEQCGCGGGGANPAPYEGGDHSPDHEPGHEPGHEPSTWEPDTHTGGDSPRHDDRHGDSGHDPSGKPSGGYGDFFDHPFFGRYRDRYSGEGGEGEGEGHYPDPYSRRGEGGEGHYPDPYSRRSDGHGMGSGGDRYGDSPYYRPSGDGYGSHDDTGKHQSYIYKSDDGRATVKYSSGPGYVTASAHATSG